MIDIKNAVISFDYQSPEIDEIARNLTTLYGTAAGSIPLDRDFGISQDFMSYPLPIAENMLVLEISEKTTYYEPRVEIKEITFDYNSGEKLIPNIIISRSENL